MHLSAAMKVMDKKTIVDRKMVKGVKREKNVLSSIDHPFIVNLLATFQGPHSIHMLLDYVQGGELFGLIYHVSKKGCVIFFLHYLGHSFTHS